MSRYYHRDGRGPTTYEAVMAEWADNKRVAYTEIGEDVSVSTVYLALDHSWGDGPPRIFETMVFGGRYDQEQERYSTESDALAGHERWVAKASEPVPSDVTDLAAVIAKCDGFYGNSLELAEHLIAHGVRIVHPGGAA